MTRTVPMTLIVLGLFSVTAANATPFGVDLGTASSFGVLAGARITNSGTTTISGNVGVAPGSAVTGLLPIDVSGTIFPGAAAAAQAQTDLVSAYNAAAGARNGIDLTGTDLGGLVLTPGVYTFSSSAQLTGNLTLNALNDPNAIFVFQIGSTLMTASNSSVTFTGGAGGWDTFFQVGSSATLGTDTSFGGNILALSDITLTTGASIECGRALARNGAVVLQSNVISGGDGCQAPAQASLPVPEPASFALLFAGLIGTVVGRTRRAAKQRA